MSAVDRMWDNAIHSSLENNQLNILLETYPENAVERFLALLIKRKQQLAAKLKNEHYKELEKVQDEINRQHELDLARTYQDAKEKLKNWSEILMKLNEIKFDRANEDNKKKTEHLSENQKRLFDLKEHIENNIVDIQKEIKSQTTINMNLAKEIKSMYRQLEEFDEQEEEMMNSIGMSKTRLKFDIEELTSRIKEKVIKNGKIC